MLICNIHTCKYIVLFFVRQYVLFYVAVTLLVATHPESDSLPRVGDTTDSNPGLLDRDVNISSFTCPKQMLVYSWPTVINGGYAPATQLRKLNDPEQRILNTT